MTKNAVKLAVTNKITYVCLAGLAVLFFLLLSLYLQDLANPLPVFAGILFTLVLRAYGLKAGNSFAGSSKALSLLVLTCLSGILIAMILRPFTVELFQYMQDAYREDPTAPRSLTEYLSIFDNRVVGYVSFFAIGYLVSRMILAMLGRSFPLLAYPRTDAELHAAYYDAAYQILDHDRRTQVHNRAGELLKDSTGNHYHSVHGRPGFADR